MTTPMHNHSTQYTQLMLTATQQVPTLLEALNESDEEELMGIRAPREQQQQHAGACARFFFSFRILAFSTIENDVDDSSALTRLFFFNLLSFERTHNSSDDDNISGGQHARPCPETAGRAARGLDEAATEPARRERFLFSFFSCHCCCRHRCCCRCCCSGSALSARPAEGARAAAALALAAAAAAADARRGSARQV